MVLIEKTVIDESALEKWTEKLPECKIFLENFFLTCQNFPPEVNYLNYVRDLKMYSPTHRHIRENLTELVVAFYQITRISEAQLDEKLRLYRLGKLSK